MAAKKRNILSVNLTDSARAEILRTVLVYEGAVRGLSMGQTLVELVMEAADLDAYPEALRTELAEFENRRLHESMRHAARRAELGRTA